MEIKLNIWDKEQTLTFEKCEYYNGNLAIQVLSEDKEYGGWEPWCSLTVNLPGFMLDNNQAFLDTNNCSKEIIDWVFNNRYAKKIATRQSGFCTYPLVEFSKKFMKEVL